MGNITCDNIGAAIADSVKRMSEQDRARVCELMDCIPDILKQGGPGQALSIDDNGNMVWVDMPVIKIEVEAPPPPPPVEEPPPPPPVEEPEPEVLPDESPDDPCWSSTVSDTGGQTKTYKVPRGGLFTVTNGPNSLAVVELAKGDVYSVKVDGGNATFKFGETEVTGPAPVTVNYISNEKKDIHSLNYSAFANTLYASGSDGIYQDWAVITLYSNITKNTEVISPFANPANVPNNLAMYQVGTIDLDAGDYYIFGTADDVGRFYIDGAFKGELRWFGNENTTGNRVGKFTFNVPTSGTHNIVMFNKNEASQPFSPAWSMTSIHKADETKVTNLNASVFDYAITTNLNCVEG